MFAPSTLPRGGTDAEPFHTYCPPRDLGFDLRSLPDHRSLGEVGGEGWRAGERGCLALLGQSGFELERGFAEGSVRDFHDGFPDE